MIYKLKLLLHALRWYRTSSAVHDAAQCLHGRTDAYVVAGVVRVQGRPTIHTIDAGPTVESKRELYEALYDHVVAVLQANPPKAVD